MSLMVVSELLIYPIKSCYRVSVSCANAEPRGFEHDRRWMIVDASNEFVSQRTVRKLATLRAHISSRGLVLRAPNLDPISVEIPSKPDQPVIARIWNDVCETWPSDEKTDDWIASFLEFKARLVYMPETTQRRVNPQFASNGEIVSFADGFPYLLASSASLQNLNAQLESPVPIHRFRPNIVISGAPPFAEDNWKLIQIGDVRFRSARPCIRCGVTCTDQESGTLRGGEPLKTLTKFHPIDGRPAFAQNLIALHRGVIKQGDAITVIE
jgi:uncharacterized protein YcbX